MEEWIVFKEWVQDYYDDFMRRCRDIKYWIRHRTVDKYHVVNTGLKPGYYDTDTRMLHANFSLLVDYVEVECAWMYYICTEDIMTNRGKELFTVFRNRELGLKHLDWEITLDDPYTKKQSESAKEIRDLYLWWTEGRPARPDPWNLIPDPPDDITQPVNKATIKLYDKVTKIENAYEKEDTKMLCRLMKVRGSMWT